jgi:transposase-like protein
MIVPWSIIELALDFHGDGEGRSRQGIRPMSQHFLLSAAARTLSLTRIMRMADDEARETFKRIRWIKTSGEPFCPHCGCLTVYTLAETPPRWKCSGCRRKFSLTSGTLFHSRKLPVRDCLAIIALFVNGVKGTSPTDQPRSQHQPEERLRVAAQAPRSYGLTDSQS